MRSALILCSLLATACGYGPSVTLACNDYAQALCDLHERCTGGTYYPHTFADRETCVRRVEVTCTVGATASGADRSSLGLETCVRALVDPAFSCADLQTNALPPTCRPTGSRANGAACGMNAQCGSGFCANVKTSSCGTCAPPPAPGASCAASDCAVGQVCQSPGLQCNVPIEAGATCVFDGPLCTYGLVCSGTAKTPSGTCVTADTQAGASCQSSHCAVQNSLSCNASTRICEVTRFVTDGQPCGVLGDGTTAVCADSGGCYLPNGGGLVTPGGSGTCKQAAADGAACDTMLGPPCTLPARCVVTPSTSTAGTCTLPAPDSCG